jgi:hypothetical protein
VLDAAGDGDAAGREVEEARWGCVGLVLVLVFAGGGVGEGPVEDGCVESFGCGWGWVVLEVFKNGEGGGGSSYPARRRWRRCRARRVHRTWEASSQS